MAAPSCRPISCKDWSGETPGTSCTAAGRQTDGQRDRDMSSSEGQGDWHSESWSVRQNLFSHNALHRGHGGGWRWNRPRSWGFIVTVWRITSCHCDSEDVFDSWSWRLIRRPTKNWTNWTSNFSFSNWKINKKMSSESLLFYFDVFWSDLRAVDGTPHPLTGWQSADQFIKLKKQKNNLKLHFCFYDLIYFRIYSVNTSHMFRFIYSLKHSQICWSRFFYKLSHKLFICW